jgi:membrane-bound ClpP family serine protease
MMEWLIVAALIISGILIILIEIIFVPGTTVVGIAGFIIGCYGIYSSYGYFGETTGHIVLVISLVAMASAIVIAFKSNAWDRFSLHSTMEGKVNDDFKVALEVGAEGDSISSLRPMGKALFNEKEVEVATLGEYVRESQPVRIIKIIDNKIYVELIK